jgi:hypothetical protein
MIWDLVDGRVPYASQLGCASDLLSAIVVPVVLRLVETGELVDGWNVDLAELRDPAGRATELSNDEAKELRRRLNVWLAAQDSATRPR